jgi:hypothetical protein
MVQLGRGGKDRRDATAEDQYRPQTKTYEEKETGRDLHIIDGRHSKSNFRVSCETSTSLGGCSGGGARRTEPEDQYRQWNGKAPSAAVAANLKRAGIFGSCKKTVDSPLNPMNCARNFFCSMINDSI